MIPNGIYLNKFLNNKIKKKLNQLSITVARYAIKKGYDLVPKLTKLFKKTKSILNGL